MGIRLAIVWLFLSVISGVLSAPQDQDECSTKACIRICNETKLSGTEIIRKTTNSNKSLVLANYNILYKPCKEVIAVDIKNWTIVEVNNIFPMIFNVFSELRMKIIVLDMVTNILVSVVFN
jgi:hypothetical protein